jgi:putative tryptophan/tyrosine transport system substrate-binding protein
MKRRAFLTLLGGAAVSWPVAARAQERVRHVGMLTGGSVAGDADAEANKAALLQNLQQLGWIEARNLRLDVRWGDANPERIRHHAAELAALAPDVILVTGATPLAALLQATRTVPIVFVNIADPVGGGFVRSLSRPGGNATGFIQYEYSLSAKWLELLKEIAPGVTRALVFRDPAIAGIGQFAVIQSVASSVGIEVSPANLQDVGEIESSIAETARAGQGGVILTGSALTISRSGLITRLAIQYKLPLICIRRYFAENGCLISYGPDVRDQYGRAAGYIDRILKGEKPADLPVQVPTRYELVVNLKTAKALGLTVPPSVLARADEVIE